MLLAAAPKRASASTMSVPRLTLTPPVKVFAPPSVRLPLPSFVSPLVPTRAELITGFTAATVICPPAPAIESVPAASVYSSLIVSEEQSSPLASVMVWAVVGKGLGRMTASVASGSVLSAQLVAVDQVALPAPALLSHVSARAAAALHRHADRNTIRRVRRGRDRSPRRGDRARCVI